MLKKIVSYFSNLWYSKIRIREENKVNGMDNKNFWRIIDNFIKNLKGKEKNNTNVLEVLDVAKYFSSQESMTHKKLQKLVYYAYAWYIALYNDTADNITNKLCPNTSFEAWVHGPVCRALYNYCGDNYGCVPKYDGKVSDLIAGELKIFLDKIYKTFGKYSGDELESMTHKEMPWQNARDTLPPSAPSNKKISEKDMFIYYNNLNGQEK